MPFSEYSHRQTNGQKFELIELMLEPDKQMCPSATIVLNSQFKTGRKNLIVFTLFLEISGKMKPKRPKYAIQHLANFKARHAHIIRVEFSFCSILLAHAFLKLT